jgi:hypothetical protein
MLKLTLIGCVQDGQRVECDALIFATGACLPAL